MKRYISFLLCLCLCFGLMVPALASDAPETELAGETALSAEAPEPVFDAQTQEEEPVTEAEETAVQAGEGESITTAEETVATEAPREEQSVSEPTTDGSGTEDGITWVVENGVLTIAGTGDMTDYRIGNTPWYSHRDTVTSLVVEEGVTGLGDFALYNFKALRTISLPESLTSIGDNVFQYCEALESADIPNGIAELGDSVFSSCSSLKSVSLPENLEILGEGCFSSCSALESIELPETLTAIGNGAFSRCELLAAIDIPAGVHTLGNSVFGSCTSLTEVVLPEGLTVIQSSLFSDCTGLEKVTMPDSVTTIQTSAFVYCSALREINISRNLKTIMRYAFRGCSALESLSLPAALKSIDSWAFENCSSLKDIYYDKTEVYWELIDGVEYVPDACTIHCLTMALPAEGSFRNSEGSDFSWSIDADGVLTIAGTGALPDYDGVSQLVNEPVLPPWIDYRSQINSVILKEGITAIGRCAFDGFYNILSANLPESLVSIGSYAFGGCTALSAAELPAALRSLDNYAFYGAALRELTVPSAVEYVGSHVFADNVSLASVVVQGAMGDSMFRGCRELVSVTIGSTLTELPRYAFYDCILLAEIQLPSTLEILGEAVFQNCIALTGVDLPEGLKNIGKNAFNNTDSLARILLPESLTYIGAYAFARNDAITAVTVPGGVESICSHAFSDCTKLETATLGEGVAVLEDSCFNGCPNLKQLHLPSTIETICQSFVLSALETLTVAEDPENKRSFYCWEDKQGNTYTTEQIVAGTAFITELYPVWLNIWYGYDDVPEGKWYYNYIQYCYELGLMQGMDETHFVPNGNATRAQVVMVLYRMAGEPEVSGTASFTDVSANSWYHDAVVWAASVGIAQGLGNGSFSPNTNVTREQFLVFLYRFADYLGLVLNDWDELYYLGSNDEESVSSWAMDAEVWSMLMGLQTGYDESDGGYSVRPKALLSRAELATFLARYSANMFFYYAAEVAEALYGYSEEAVLQSFGPADRTEVDGDSKYRYYDDYGLVLELRWYAEEEYWYMYDWWWA